MVQTLREFISVAEKENLVIHITRNSCLNDIPQILNDSFYKEKILLFDQIEYYQCKIISNLVPSHRIWGTLLESSDPYAEFLSRLGKKGSIQLLPPSESYVEIDESELDVTRILPVLTHYEEDTGPFITTGIASALDPVSGVVARGIHRMGWRGKNRFGIALLNPPLSELYLRYAAEGKDMPVAVVIGVDPITFLSMALKTPNGQDKLELTASLKGGLARAMPSFGLNIPVPWEAEYILEGYVRPQEMGKDGTLGEISGYPMTFGDSPTLFVTRIYHKNRPYYHALMPTSAEADSYLTFVSRAHLEKDLRRLFPFVSDMVFIKKTFGCSLVLCVEETKGELIRNLIVFSLSFPMVKKTVVVDKDVNIYDLNDVEWAINTRCRFDKDVIIIEGLKGQPIDPTMRQNSGVTKLGLDATRLGKDIGKRVNVKKGDITRVSETLKCLGV